MDAVGIVFSNIHDSALPELTRVRTIASVPYAGRYRFIDFALSNLVNSGITNIGIITKSNYQSLMDHVGTGKEWDLARKSGGLRILPPYGARDSSYYTSRLEALKGCMSFLTRAAGEYVILCDSDNVCNIAYDEVIEYHEKKHADMTCVYKEMKVEQDEVNKVITMECDKDGKMTDIWVHPYKKGASKVIMNMWVMKKELLRSLVMDAIAHAYTSFTGNIIRPNIKKLQIYCYEFTGYYGVMDSLKHYYKNSMDILKKEVRSELFYKNDRAIYTKVKDSAPTRYDKGAKVSNSFISDGCEINGVVENSILSRGVKVGKGAIIQNCILMQETMVGADVILNSVITDKNVVLRDKITLSGCEELPFYVDKGRIL